MCECLKAVRNADGGKKAGIGMICVLVIQLIYLILYGWVYLNNPDLENGKVNGCVTYAEKAGFAAGECRKCPSNWMEKDSGYTSPTDQYLFYFAAMFWLCALQILASLMMVIANCCTCCARLAWWPNCVVQVSCVVMLIMGSIWRFSQAGRSCATDVTLAKASLTEDVITTSATSASKLVKKEAQKQIDKAMRDAGLGGEERK